MLRIVKPTNSIGPDPRARRIVEALSGHTNFSTLTAREARRAYRESRTPYLWPLDEVGEVVGFGRSARVPAVRLFRPLAQRPGGRTFVFVHGGGWSVGDLSTYEPLCRRLTRILEAHILWVEYRLAPEHPFPAPLDDVLAACGWLLKMRPLWGSTPPSSD